MKNKFDSLLFNPLFVPKRSGGMGIKMREYSRQNKEAWEYNAYDFWVKHSGTPVERAKRDLKNPIGMLKRYSDYFETYQGVKIANICGSCGKKAVPLAILGAEVTVFDISEDNKKYALEVAAAAKVDLNFEVCDILEIDTGKYGNYFDVVFMEGGVLHYFHDIDEFMRIMHSLLKDDGKMICSDFHPFTKISDILSLEQPEMSYFSTEIFEGEMAHARFFDENIREQMPKCSYRKYTISEIINAIIHSGFTLKKFDEHPAWTNEKIPGEFTIVAGKQYEHRKLRTTEYTCEPNSELLNHLDELHTTELGIARIKKNLSLDTDDVVAWCKDKINSPHAAITRRGKNWYINVDDIVITVNAHSYTIITAH